MHGLLLDWLLLRRLLLCGLLLRRLLLHLLLPLYRRRIKDQPTRNKSIAAIVIDQIPISALT